MIVNLETAIVYDIETIVNCFTLNVQPLHGDWEATFEISEWRDDRALMLQWFEHWRANQTPMVSFNGLNFDYPVLHFIWQNSGCQYWDIYEKAQEQIKGLAQFKTVRPSDCFAPQIDVSRIWHFENKAKMTSLKALQVNMRSETVLEMPLPFDRPISREDVDRVLIPYNRHDVAETKKFALISLDAIKFRIELMDMLHGDVLNWNDTKIGAKLVEQRLGDELCYEWVDGRRQVRQTKREFIRLADIIFPFIRFTHPEFNRILTWMKSQTLHSDEVTGRLKTKGIFTDIHATAGGMEFHFGTGGIHGAIPTQVIVPEPDEVLNDIDVAGMYPANMIANRLYPEHLGEKFVEEFSQLPIERAKYKKGTPRNKAFKLGGNGTFGNTNNEHSVFLDSQVTMATTVNGQLEICMLAEWLLTVPTLSMIQANTDGLTYRVKREHLPRAREVQKAWEAYTRLVLEEVEYARIWLRDVNNYVAESVGGKLKRKGAYWYPVNFPADVTDEAVWHKDLSNIISVKAAVEYMTRGVPIERTIHECGDSYLFMLRAKCDRNCKLFIGDTETQRIMRYYVAVDGGPLRKIMPPKGPAGAWKRKNGITDHEYYSVLKEVGDAWDARIHTANKSTYEQRETAIQSGWLVADCSRASDFDWNNVAYQFYIAEAEKLVIR